jgi:hypothetical protein
MGGAVAVVLLTEQLIVVGVVWHEEIDDDAVANLGAKFSFYREKIGLLGFHIRIWSGSGERSRRRARYALLTCGCERTLRSFESGCFSSDLDGKETALI